MAQALMSPPMQRTTDSWLRDVSLIHEYFSSSSRIRGARSVGMTNVGFIIVAAGVGRWTIIDMKRPGPPELTTFKHGQSENYKNNRFFRHGRKEIKITICHQKKQRY
jgi:hypothetical protein